MSPYIAMHGELPKRELPQRMRHMHKHSIYIDEDICKRNPRREQRIIFHEVREMEQFEAHPGISYKRAHRRAGYWPWASLLITQNTDSTIENKQRCPRKRWRKTMDTHQRYYMSTREAPKRVSLSSWNQKDSKKYEEENKAQYESMEESTEETTLLQLTCIGEKNNENRTIRNHPQRTNQIQDRKQTRPIPTLPRITAFTRHDKERDKKNQKILKEKTHDEESNEENHSHVCHRTLPADHHASSKLN